MRDVFFLAASCEVISVFPFSLAASPGTRLISLNKYGLQALVNERCAGTCEPLPCATLGNCVGVASGPMQALCSQAYRADNPKIAAIVPAMSR